MMPPPAPTFVLYHAHCADGFGAAFAAWLRLGQTATYLPVTHGEPIPALPEGADIYILDFSYARQTLEILSERSTVKVFDHHLTAREALAGLPFAVFDAAKSGAVLAWEHFHGTEPPLLLQYVQDRDLWRWQLPQSEEVSAGLQLQGFDFATWQQILDAGEMGIAELEKVGVVALAQKRQLVARLCEKARWGVLAGHRVPIVNSPVFQSEIGHELLARHELAPFAAIYFDDEKCRRIWSLRSRADFNVAAIAKNFGGGGHAQAAGFERRVEAVNLAP